MEEKFGFNQQFTTEICGRVIKYNCAINFQTKNPVVSICLYNEKYELTRIKLDDIFYTPEGFIAYCIKIEGFWNKHQKLNFDDWVLFQKFMDNLLTKEDFINAFCDAYHKMYS
jgi:hypothetical protein